jgi:lysophospholipase L1-like esterase
MPKPQRHMSVRSRKILFSILAVVLFFTISELLVRFAWTEKRSPSEMPANSQQKWMLPPSGELELEGVTNKINSLGLRGPEISLEKADCTYRIYTAGDSCVYGHGIPDSKAFVELLPELLRGKFLPTIKLEAINGGVPGYSTYQSIAQLDLLGWRLKPDLLVIGNIWNDAAGANAPDRLFFDSQETGKNRLAETFSRSALYRFIVRSALPPHPVFQPGKNHDGPYDRVPVDEYNANLRHLISQTRSKGGDAILVMLPCLADQQSSKAGPFEDQSYRDAMESVGTDLSVPIVRLPEVFSEMKETLFLDPYHPNVAGHALIAEKLSETILESPGLFSALKNRCEVP